MEKIAVMPAEPYRECALGSRGNAKYMLLRQFQFPSEYYEHEQIAAMDSDRVYQWDYANFIECYREFNLTETFFEYSIRLMDEDEIISFLKKILKADPKVKWTGFRIMGTVSDNGHSIFTWQLFAKDSKSDTQVYSGDEAPNVRVRK